MCIFDRYSAIKIIGELSVFYTSGIFCCEMSELNKNNTYHLSLTFLKWFKIYPDKTKRNSKQFYAKKALLPLATLVLTLLNAVHLIVVLQGKIILK